MKKITRKNFRRFRLSLIIVFLAGLLSEPAGASINAPITINERNKTIEDVLEIISQRYDITFVLRTPGIDTHRLVTLEETDLTIGEVVEKLFGDQPVTWEIVDDNTVKISKLEPSPVDSRAPQAGRLVSGVILDGDGEPIVGATVLVKGSSQGTISGTDGRFTLNLTQADNILVVSSLGYLPQEVNVGRQTELTVVMQGDNQLLDEVVVVGYGTMKRKDLTGAVSRINTENVASQAPRNVHDLLRGNAAGMNVEFATNAKGEADISIRGNGSLTANSSPLIVLDGVIYEGALSDINPQDIETIDILKDASAVAVFGAKSANGVVAITTKRGKSGKPVITANVNVGVAQKAYQPALLNPEEFLQYRQDYNEGRQSDDYLAQYPQIYTNPMKLNGVNQLDWYNYDQATPATSVTENQLMSQWLSRLLLRTPEIENYFAGKITKWDDLVLQTALLQDYNVSISSATDNTNLYASIGYVDREGIVVGDRYQVVRFRMNGELKITDFLTVGANTQFASRNEGFVGVNWGAMAMATPYGSNNMDDPDSPYRVSPNGWGGDCPNPFYARAYTDRYNRIHNINGNLYAKVFFPFGIEYQMNFTPYFHFNEYFNHESSKSESWAGNGGNSRREHSRRYNWQIDNIVRWKQEFAGAHRFEVTLLANAEKAQYWRTQANARQYSPNDVLSYHRLQAGSVPTAESEDTYQTGSALMARLFYSWRNKYMLTASIRRDGYSAFGKQNPYATFPSVALGWVFTQENFMEAAQNWLSYGKLRLTWGVNGNRDIGIYAALSDLASRQITYINPSGNVYTTSEIYANKMANHALRWEKSESWNAGLDFGLFNDIVTGSAEVYFMKTNDLLVNRALPNLTGFSNVTSNLGQVDNTGFELTLNARIMDRKNFKWTASGTFSLNRRKIATLYGDMVPLLDARGDVIGQQEMNDETNGWFIGQDPDRVWEYERLGVWQLDEATEAAVYGCQPGDFKYKDQDGNGVMDNEDKIFQGYKTPRFRWSMQHNLSYKGFNLSFMLYSYWNYYNSFQRAANNQDGFPDRTSSYKFPRWTRTNPIDDYARVGSKNIGTNYVNRSFIRLEHVTLSYDIPKSFSQKFAVQNMSVSVGVQNAAMFAPHWTFWDPENGSLSQRLFNLSLNITM